MTVKSFLFKEGNFDAPQKYENYAVDPEFSVAVAKDNPNRFIVHSNYDKKSGDIFVPILFFMHFLHKQLDDNKEYNPHPELKQCLVLMKKIDALNYYDLNIASMGQLGPHLAALMLH